jgi:hypothetical protein
MKTKHVIFLIILFVIASNLNAQDWLKKLAKGVAGLTTDKTTTLKDALVTTQYRSNCFPQSLSIKTGDEMLIGEDWPDQGSLVSITLFKAQGLGAFEIDGSVTLDGKEMKYYGNGLYAISVADNSTKTIIIKTSTGETTNFDVIPQKPVKLLEPRDSKINLNNGVHLKLDNPPGTENTMVRVSVYSKPTLFQKSWHSIDFFRSQNEFTVPLASFASTADNKYDYIDGSSYILVERVSMETKSKNGICEMRNISSYYDYAPVDISYNDLDDSLSTKSEDADGFKIVTQPGGILVSQQKSRHSDDDPYKPEVTIIKNSIYSSVPFSKAKKFAVISFTTRATGLKKEITLSSVSYRWEKQGDWLVENEYRHSETFTKQFPDLPVSYWQNISDMTFKELQKEFKAKLNIEIIPVQDVMMAPSYKDMSDIEEIQSSTQYVGSYKGLKNLYAQNLSSLLGGYTGPVRRLMKELGVDGIITLDLNLQVPDEVLNYKNPRDYNYALNPLLTYNIFAPPNGTEYLPAAYTFGFVKGEGITLQKLGKGNGDKWEFTPDVLYKACHGFAIVDNWVTGLVKLKYQESRFGYDKVWLLK